MDDKSSVARKKAQQSNETRKQPLNPAQNGQKAKKVSSQSELQSTGSAAQASTLSKKKKTKLIIGIVAGSLTLMLLLVAILLYFLWWQNPQKIVTDAIANSITTKKAISSGKLTIDAGNKSKLELDIKAATDAPKTKADVTAKLTVDNMSESINLQSSFVLDEKGTIYIKIEGMKKLVDAVVDMAMKLDRTAQSSMRQLDVSARTKYYEAFRKQITEKVDPIVAKLENKWLKISINDLAQDKSTKCLVGAIHKMQTDDSVKREIADLYAKNGFLIVDDKVKLESRNGGRGFEIDLGNSQTQSLAKEFSRGLQESQIGKEIEGCGNTSRSENSRRYNRSGTFSKGDAKLRLWVNEMSHTLKAVEFIGSGENNTKISMSMEFDPGKSEQIDVPSNTEDLQDVVKELTEEIPGTASSSSSSTSFYSSDEE